MLVLKHDALKTYRTSGNKSPYILNLSIGYSEWLTSYFGLTLSML